MKIIKESKVVPLLLDTYLATVKNSVGIKTFRNVYAKVNGRKTDIAQNGNLSCAIFVSSILFLFKLIKDVHATVNSTIRDLKESGWLEIKKPKDGCILVWAEKDFGVGGRHRHLGFYVGKGKAVSNNSKLGYPTQHDWNKYNGRVVELILWNPKLKN